MLGSNLNTTWKQNCLFSAHGNACPLTHAHTRVFVIVWQSACRGHTVNNTIRQRLGRLLTNSSCHHKKSNPGAIDNTHIPLRGPPCFNHNLVSALPWHPSTSQEPECQFCFVFNRLSRIPGAPGSLGGCVCMCCEFRNKKLIESRMLFSSILVETKKLPSS